MDAAEGHRQKARSSGPSGCGTPWYLAPVTVTQRNPLTARNSVSARRVNRRRWPATTLPGLPYTPRRLTSEKIGWTPRTSRPRLYQAARFGVDSSSEPPGRSTRRASATAPSGSTRCSISSLMITTSAASSATGRPGATPPHKTVRPRARARRRASEDQSIPANRCAGFWAAVTARAEPSPQPTSTITAGPTEFRSTSASILAWRRARSGPERSGTPGVS